MNGFKFKIVNNKFRWESDFMVLEFSNPSIQGFSDYTNLKDEKEIMYYYYTVKIFKKIISWNDKNNEIKKWGLVSKRDTYDFPCILELKWILDYQLKDDTKINGQRIEYNSGDIRYSKVMETEGFACDDFYEVTKSVNEKGKDDRYIVYCGTTFDLNGDLNNIGIRTPYVSKKDIEELFKCVSEFIQYSLNKHNKQIKFSISNFEIKNNKVYKHTSGNKKKNKIEAIYKMGDIVNIITVVNNLEKRYDNVTIDRIEDISIILKNGEIITPDSIVYMSNESAKEILNYKEDEVAKEFLDVLSDEEKKEFRNSNVELLLSKYKMAIINRTWMCREEHGFDIDYEHGERITNITPIVKSVINLIKSNLN